MQPRDVVIVSACRTAIGKFQGQFKGVSARELAITAGKEAIRRAGIDINTIDEIVMGECYTAMQGSLPARQVSMRIGLPIESSAVTGAARSAGAKYVSLIEEPMAAAIGAGLPVSEPTGSMVVDIGGGTSEVAVISLGDVVTSNSARVAGDNFDESIINYIKKKYNLLIGERTAEDIKIKIGSAYPYAGEGAMNIKGRNLMDGLPKNIEISAEEIREALSDSVNQILDVIKATLEKTPPELAADIIDHGIMLTGGGALLRGLDKLIAAETRIPVLVAESPLDCVVDGTGICLEHPLNK